MVTQEEVVQWLYAQAVEQGGSSASLGDIEKILDRVSKEPRRQALERLAQRTAAQQPLACPDCDSPLKIDTHRRSRTVKTCSGDIRLVRSYGFCPQCSQYHYPADVALGLQARSPASPRVQEICALTALRAPAGQAQDDIRRLADVDLEASVIHREARRQGDRAIKLRQADEERTQTLQGVKELAQRAALPKAPFTLIIEIDAWNIRERDNWGRTEALRKAGQDTGRWHWVYTATVFRLDQRGTTASGRPVIAERGFVATRQGLESFSRQLYAEALQRGLLNADLVLILADGAVWIWNLADDRFGYAQQRVDLHHVQEHLWNLAHLLHAQDTHAANQWVRPFLHWLEHRKDGALDVIESLKQLRTSLKTLTSDQRQTLDREINYFTEHKNRMDYKAGKALGQPVGSGAIESTCSQYQRRFKLTGQFWSLQGDEAFLALATLHRNGRWHHLFPHDSG